MLSLIQTRADLHRWVAANDHGARMHEAVNLLEAAADVLAGRQPRAAAPGSVLTAGG